ncbi:MAG: response regulator [Anaerolineae bacterium]|nr:response regulator [Anaerolineae bacterium]
MAKNEKTILIVEDLDQIRDLLEVTLRFEGYEVLSAGDGLEAIDTLEKGHPDLIITDLLMPNLDGYGLIFRLRSNPDTHSIPIMVLSATYLSGEDKDFAYHLGAQRFLEKPVDAAVLLETVSEVLNGGGEMMESPVDDEAFYARYRGRLESKLQQKSKQITRMERLMKTLPEAQKGVFQTLLAEAREHKDEVTAELQTIDRNLMALAE